MDKELSNAPRMETVAEMNDQKHIALHTEERLNMIGFRDIVKVKHSTDFSSLYGLLNFLTSFILKM